MRFQVTPEEGQETALAMLAYFKKQKMQVKVEVAAWPTAPYRSTLVAEKAGRCILVEAQGQVSYGSSLKELVAWIASRRYYAEVYIATCNDAVIQAGVLRELKEDGVGLFVVDDARNVVAQHRARNPALVVTPEPTLKYGPEKAAVESALHKFNEVDRKDGLRDMCEIVERLTYDVGIAACRKGWLQTPEANFQQYDWSRQINEPECVNDFETPSSRNQ